MEKNETGLKNTLKELKKMVDYPVIEPPFDIKNLDDLLKVAYYYHGDNEYFDWFELWTLIPIIEKINSLVGMKKIKKDVVNLILYRLSRKGKREKEMYHTVLAGPPGCGKTTISKYLAVLYHELGLIKTNNIIEAKRTDFIGKYIGWSEDKTTNLLKSAIDGVLFIDEGYSLGNKDVDGFSKAAIDLLCSFLDKHAHECICIIAGYEEELETCFFSVNPGLKRRFPKKFTIRPYSPKELFKIFLLKVDNSGYTLQKDDNKYVVTPRFFRRYKNFFEFYGGDIDNFLEECKKVHSKHTFGMEEGYILSEKDIKQAIKNFSETKGTGVYKKIHIIIN